MAPYRSQPMWLGFFCLDVSYIHELCWSIAPENSKGGEKSCGKRLGEV